MGDPLTLQILAALDQRINKERCNPNGKANEGGNGGTNDPLTLQILAALDQRINKERCNPNGKANEGGNGGTNGAAEDADDDKMRRKTFREDGRTRTHKRKVPSGTWKPPNPTVWKERVERDAKRLCYGWWLRNY